MVRRNAVSLVVVVLLIGAVSGSAGANGVIRSASGEGGQTTGAGFGMRTFEFHVLEQDGTVRGEIHVVNPVTAADRVFQLDCLNVIPGSNGSPIAVGGGVVVASENPALLGQRGLFAVQDNGEGQNDPPDRMTLGVLLTTVPCSVFTDETSLRTVFPRGLVDIDEGNIQVRP